MESDPRSGSPRLLVLGARPGSARAARGGARARPLDRRRRPRSRRRPASASPTGAASSRPRTSRRSSGSPARSAIDGIIAPGTDWPVGVAARIAERLGLPHPISPADGGARDEQAAPARAARRGRRAAAALVGRRRRGRAARRSSWPGRRQGARPAGPEGPDARRRPRPSSPAAIETARGAVARTALALVEELVDGPEVTVVGFSVDGVFTALAVTDRLVAEPPAFGVALAHVWPSEAGGRGRRTWPRAAVAALGIEDGPSYTQLRVGAGRAAGDRGRGAARRRARRRARRGGDRRRPERPRDRRGARRAASPCPRPSRGSAARSRASSSRRRACSSRSRCRRTSRRRARPHLPRARLRLHAAPPRRRPGRGGARHSARSRDEALARADAAAERIRFVTADAGALLQAS